MSERRLTIISVMGLEDVSSCEAARGTRSLGSPLRSQTTNGRSRELTLLAVAPPAPQHGSMPPNQNDPFPALQRALEGRYDLKHEIARGGMGIVYLAHEIALDRPVALKLLPPDLAAEPRRRERFLREARTAARLTHPNIVPIYAVDEIDGFVFFTMTLVEGETLARRIATRGPLPTEEATRVLREVAWAVAYAHAQGVIHRDLKAENILVERESGRVLVTDFGIAQVRGEPDGFDEGTVVGTFKYMSPEQAEGRPVDERSDVYSLGIMGHLVAGGTVPFTDGNAHAILRQQIYQPAPPLATVAEGVDHTLARAVDRCLAKRPEHRFPSAADLAEALESPRTLPAPLRVFLHKVRWTSRAHTGLSLVAVLALLQGISALAQGRWVLAGLAGGAIALAYAAPVAYLLPAVRRALRAGHTRADMVHALRVDLDLKREELAVQVDPRAGLTERVARITALAGVGLFGIGVVLALTTAVSTDLVLGSMTVGAGTAIVAGLIAAGRTERRRDRTGERWLRFWGGRVGQWATRLAAIGLGHLPVGAGTAPRRVEAVIAEATSRLYRNLPEGVREVLGDVSGLASHLEIQTMGTRALLAELDGSDATDSDMTSAELEVAREEARERLADSVTALERVRLTLLQFHAGLATVDTVSEELAMAREIRDVVDELLAQRRDAGEA